MAQKGASSDNAAEFTSHYAQMEDLEDKINPPLQGCCQKTKLINKNFSIGAGSTALGSGLGSCFGSLLGTACGAGGGLLVGYGLYRFFNHRLNPKNQNLARASFGLGAVLGPIAPLALSTETSYYSNPATTAALIEGTVTIFCGSLTHIIAENCSNPEEQEANNSQPRPKV